MISRLVHSFCKKISFSNKTCLLTLEYTLLHLYHISHLEKISFLVSQRLLENLSLENFTFITLRAFIFRMIIMTVVIIIIIASVIVIVGNIIKVMLKFLFFFPFILFHFFFLIAFSFSLVYCIHTIFFHFLILSSNLCFFYLHSSAFSLLIVLFPFFNLRTSFLSYQ